MDVLFRASLTRSIMCVTLGFKRPLPCDVIQRDGLRQSRECIRSSSNEHSRILHENTRVKQLTEIGSTLQGSGCVHNQVSSRTDST